MKTSLAPGSQVVAEYLAKAGLQKDLDALGFNLVGYGCTTCIGNSGPLPDAISKADQRERSRRRRGALRQPQFRRPRQPGRARELSRLAAAGRRLCARRLAAGRPRRTSRSARGADGKPVYLKDIWPTSKEIADLHAQARSPRDCSRSYADVFKGDEHWREHHGRRGRHLRLGPEVDLRAEPALFRGHGKNAGAGRPTSSTRASSGCSSIRSPPTTSRRPARSRPTSPGRQVSDRPRRAACSTSTPTARGAATTK